MRVTDEQARILADGDYEPVVQIGIGTTINMAHLAADLLDARAEIATLRAKLAAVCEAGSATQKAFEEQAECGDCDAKAEAMGNVPGQGGVSADPR